MVFTLLAASGAWAQEEEAFEDEFRLLEEEVVYSAAKHKQDIADAPAAVSVITREQIDKSPCSSLSCLLRQLPETEVVLFTPAHTSIGVRSLSNDTQDRVLVLVDGREVNFDIVGPPLYEAMAIHLADIERIEMVRGPGSALYGANAYLAVISIATREVHESGAKVHAAAGEPGALDLYGRLEQKLGNWGLHLSASMEQGGDWLLRGLNQRQVHRTRLRVDRQTEASSTQLEIGYSDPRGMAYSNIAPIQFGNSRFAYFLASHRRESWEGRLSLTLMQSDLNINMNLFYGSLKLGELPKVFRITNPILTADWQGNLSPWNDNLLIGGLSYRWNTFLSPDNAPDSILEHSLGVFVHDEQRLFDQLLLTLGARLDYNTITPLSFSPRASLVWRLGQHNLRLSLGQSFRKPSIFNTSIHIKGVKGIAGIEEFFEKQMGTPGLGNERISTVELGYRGRFLDGRLATEGTLFYSQYRNTIGIFFKLVTNSLGIPDLSSSSVSFTNAATEVDGLGGSLSVSWQWLENLRLTGNYTYQYRYWAATPQNQPSTKKGDYYLGMPDHLFNLGGDYQSKVGIRMGLNFHYESKKMAEATDNGSPFGNYQQHFNAPVVYVSLLLAYRMPLSIGWVEAGVKAYNMFNSPFKDCPQFYRTDGSYIGCQSVGQQIWLFFDTSL